MEQEHPTDFAPNQLQALLDLCATPIDKHYLGTCPLCFRERQHLRSHLARHSLTLALFVLPKIAGVERENADSNGVQAGGSEDSEEFDASHEALSKSDEMSDISEHALIEVPDLQGPAGSSANFDADEENPVPLEINQHSSFDKSPAALLERWSDQPTIGLQIKTLPSFLQSSNEGELKNFHLGWRCVLTSGYCRNRSEIQITRRS